VLRVEGGLFFANAEHVRTVLLDAASEAGVNAVIVDGGTIPAIDVTAVEMLRQARDEMATRGVRLVLARDSFRYATSWTRRGASPGRTGPFRRPSRRPSRNRMRRRPTQRAGRD
jgi:MFS superfamily sulfate permease-like transporter